MTSGNAIEVSNKGNGLTTGSLLNLESFATASDSGIVRVNSNNVKSGKIISIEANALTSGNAIEVTNNGENLTTGSLLHLNSLASNAQNGIANVVGNNVQDGSIVSIEGNSLTTGSLLNLKSHSLNPSQGVVQIDTSKMTKGKGIVLDLSEMTEGTGIEMNDNTNLTSGKLLDIRTTSSNALNPVSIAANAITNGKVVEISSDGITSGSTMVLSTNNGDKMINTLMGEKISEIKANGELRTKKDVSENLFVNDNVILDNCEDTLSSNDGSYLVKSLTRNVVTKYTCAVECHNSSIVVTTTASTSNATNNATNATTTTSASPVASYVCAIVSDCPASNRSVEYVESNSCTSSNNTFCDNSVEYEFVKLVKEDGSDISNLVARNGGDGTISCEISRLGGDILSVDGNNQASGTLLNIKADKLQNGIGMHIHNMENDTLTSGSLLQVSTKTSSPENGVVRVNSNNVKSG